jgi:tetratricopeptide (TPR) repeat protein
MLKLYLIDHNMKRMKYLILFTVLLLSVLPKRSAAQNDDIVLRFDKKYIQCENKWIAIVNKDTTLTYGFVYIDTQAGLTLDVAGSFKIVKNVFVPTPRENSSMKVRIPVNNNRIAIIPSARFKELGVLEEPEWLKNYKSDATLGERNYRIGFIYNEWNECATALTYLEKAKAIEPNFKGLKAEFAFAYNALKQYDKAVVVLKEALNESKGDCYLHKELVYAQMNLGMAEEAKASAIKGIADCNDGLLKGEMAYNIAYQYYKLKDKVQFQTWASETAKWIKPDHELIRALADLKIKLDN